MRNHAAIHTALQARTRMLAGLLRHTCVEARKQPPAASQTGVLRSPCTQHVARVVPKAEGLRTTYQGDKARVPKRRGQCALIVQGHSLLGTISALSAAWPEMCRFQRKQNSRPNMAKHCQDANRICCGNCHAKASRACGPGPKSVSAANGTWEFTKARILKSP